MTYKHYGLSRLKLLRSLFKSDNPKSYHITAINKLTPVLLQKKKLWDRQSEGSLDKDCRQLSGSHHQNHVGNCWTVLRYRSGS